MAGRRDQRAYIPRGVQDPLITHAIRLGRIQSARRGVVAVLVMQNGEVLRGPVKWVEIDRELSRAKTASNLVVTLEGARAVRLMDIAEVRTAESYDAQHG
jgi:multidrug efflux pump subunit AcrB